MFGRAVFEAMKVKGSLRLNFGILPQNILAKSESFPANLENVC